MKNEKLNTQTVVIFGLLLLSIILAVKV